jgi:cytochrome c biogenesis protein CcdA
MEDRRRLFLLGFTFIFVSALVYFAFLAAWFNLFQFIGLVYWVRLLVGLVAIGSGIYHLKNYYEKETGCKVTNSEQRSKLMKRMKNVIQRRNLWLALVGISALAVSVNLIELVCSAGLPAIYTNILSLTDLTTVEYYAYLALYTLIFMIDDLFVFSVAVKTFEVTGITSKYSKMSNLIGGIVILILGILLLFRPQALMFG